MTGRELASALEVSERTVVRDVEALSIAGVPVYADRGRTGGYRLVGGYRTQLTGLSRDEAEALFLSGVAGPLQDMGLADVAATAQLKVLAALPRELRDSGTVAAQRFHLDVPRWFHAAPPPPVLAAVATATWTDRAVSATCRRGDRYVDRRLEPYGLILKAGVWYTVARVRETFRVYRVDRLAEVAVLDQPFRRDRTFDLAAFWRERSVAFERSLLTTHARVRLSPAGVRRLWSAVERLAAEQAMASAGEPDGDGWVTVTLPVESLDIGYDQVVALGPEAEVLDPPELRARVAAATARLNALYR